jgi:hypothetical protein
MFIDPTEAETATAPVAPPDARLQIVGFADRNSQKADSWAPQQSDRPSN